MEDLSARLEQLLSDPQMLSQLGELAAGLGLGAWMLAQPAGSHALWWVVGLASVLGGLLSTWSPCGYSSISLLRPTGPERGAVWRWLPTFAAHGAGRYFGDFFADAGFGGQFVERFCGDDCCIHIGQQKFLFTPLYRHT